MCICIYGNQKKFHVVTLKSLSFNIEGQTWKDCQAWEAAVNKDLPLLARK